MSASAALTDGLVSFWGLNETSGTRADNIGSNNLSVVGSAVTGVGGKVGNSALFQDASTGYLSVANNSSFNTSGGDFSISLWVYLNNRTGTQVFASKYSSGGYAIYYESISSAFMFSTYAGGGLTTGSALGNPNTGTWYHIVGVHDSVANTNTMRINDQYENTITSVTDQPDTAGPFTIGAFGSGGLYTANGRVDAVGFWNRKLTSGEITTLYGGGNGVELTADSVAPAISNVSSSSVSDTGATITWDTDEAASTKIVYSTDTSYNLSTTETDTGTRVLSHSKTLSSLTACTTYNYKVVSADSSGNYATSSAHTFTTIGCPDPVTVSAPASRGASVRNRVNNLIAMGNIQEANRIKSEWAYLFGNQAASVQMIKPTAAVLYRDLDIGSQGEDVTALQNMLILKGLSIPAGVTGYFGAQTRSALSVYQRTNNIVPASGYFGAKTRAFINK